MSAAKERNVVKRLISASVEETEKIASSLLPELGCKGVIALYGELGSGKTCFVQGMARAMGVLKVVTSPTYTIINEYSGKLALYHIDLYRLRSLEEITDIGIEDYLDSDGITVIEWAEKIRKLLPPRTIHITFEIQPDRRARKITIVSSCFNTLKI